MPGVPAPVQVQEAGRLGSAQRPLAGEAVVAAAGGPRMVLAGPGPGGAEGVGPGQPGGHALQRQAAAGEGGGPALGLGPAAGAARRALVLGLPRLALTAAAAGANTLDPRGNVTVTRGIIVVLPLLLIGSFHRAPIRERN